MWKCEYCEKTNFDDQAICPYCNAPNPAGSKHGQQVQQGGPPQPPQSELRQTPPNWEAQYSPNNRHKSDRSRLDTILKYMVIGAAALLIIFLISVMIQKRIENKTITSGSQQTAEERMEQEEQSDNTIAPVITETPAPTATPTPAVTPEPTREPVFVEAAADLYMDFGETYQCTTDDFVLPYDISDNEVVWCCEENESGTICSKNGWITAGNTQVDAEEKFNEAVTVTGTTPDGSELTYTLYSGDGRTYDFEWSSSRRNMKSFNGYIIVASPMVVECGGFSIYYEYELVSGKIESDNWSVWVRKDGTEWIRVDDIKVKNRVGDVYDIVFDYPISFSEICVQPETYSSEYSYNNSFAVGYLIF